MACCHFSNEVCSECGPTRLKRAQDRITELQKTQLEYAKGAFTAGAAFNHKHDSVTEALLEKGFAEYWAGVEDLKKRLG